MVAWIWAAGSLIAATTTLTPVADTSLWQSSPDNNFGAELVLNAGSTDDGLPNRALFRFDIANFIPSNATIQTVTLNLTVTRGTALQAASFSLHKVLRSWGEGTKVANGAGALATSGEATWNARFFPATSWSAAGGAAPVDFVSLASGSQFISAPAMYSFASTSKLVADVQDWLTNAANNFGWFLICDQEGDFDTNQSFGSREDPTQGPQLIIEYSVPPRPHVTIVASIDTSLMENSPDNNLGAATLVAGGNGQPLLRNRALMQFSTEEIPANALLTSATLSLSVYRLPEEGVAQSPTFDLHRMLRPWHEGNKGAYVATNPGIGDSADPGETTWSCRVFPDTNSWSAPGAAAPIDFVSAVSSHTRVPGFGTYYFTNLLSDVRYWMAHPQQNYGWILICEQEDNHYSARRFSSREDTNLVSLPMLTVEYIPEPRIYRAQANGSRFTLSFVVEVGLASTVEYRDSLATNGNWITYTNLPAAPVTLTNTVSAPIVGPKRFYRVMVQ